MMLETSNISEGNEEESGRYISSMVSKINKKITVTKILLKN